MANEKNLIPAKAGNKLAAKPVELHAKNRTLRFTDADWADLKATADELGVKRTDVIKSAVKAAKAEDMSQNVAHMYQWLLEEYIESNEIESIEGLMSSYYEAELDRVFGGDVPNDIRDAALIAFR